MNETKWFDDNRNTSVPPNCNNLTVLLISLLTIANSLGTDLTNTKKRKCRWCFLLAIIPVVFSVLLFSAPWHCFSATNRLFCRVVTDLLQTTSNDRKGLSYLRQLWLWSYTEISTIFLLADLVLALPATCSVRSVACKCGATVRHSYLNYHIQHVTD